MVRHFLARASAGEDLNYHGTGSRMQDFIYVADVADAVCRCVARNAQGVLNIASGRAISMKNLAATVVEAVDRPVRIVASGEPDGQEGRTALYSIEAARHTLAWEPATTLRRGLEQWRDSLADEST